MNFLKQYQRKRNVMCDVCHQQFTTVSRTQVRCAPCAKIIINQRSAEAGRRKRAAKQK